jgi:hypothetical protein
MRSQAQQESVRKAAKVSAAKRKTDAKPAPVPRPCACECGGITKGGEFCIGHDARFKSSLVKAALGREGGAPISVKEAEAELARRNWTQFLEKSRNVAVRVPSEHKAKIAVDKAETAAVNVDRLEGMKAAAARVKEAGRNGRSSADQRITVTRDNYETINAASIEELKAWPANEVIIVHEPGKGDGDSDD